MRMTGFSRGHLLKKRRGVSEVIAILMLVLIVVVVVVFVLIFGLG